MQRAQELGVVDHRERRHERAEEVLGAERVDAVLHAHARVVLREHGRRHAHRRTPRCVVAAAYPTASSMAPPPTAITNDWRSTPSRCMSACSDSISAGDCLAASPPGTTRGAANSSMRPACAAQYAVTSAISFGQARATPSSITTNARCRRPGSRRATHVGEQPVFGGEHVAREANRVFERHAQALCVDEIAGRFVL